MARGERLIGSAAELVDGGKALRFELVRGGERLPAFAVRYRGRVYAYANRCAHVGIELDWLPGEVFDDRREHLVCSTHGALYAPDSGACVAGPCRGGRLERVEVAERDGKVYLVISDHG
jgi:nitrite reductase/ring-hydroxylating ferredoxin subunit